MKWCYSVCLTKHSFLSLVTRQITEYFEKNTHIINQRFETKREEKRVSNVSFLFTVVAVCVVDGILCTETINVSLKSLNTYSTEV